MNVRRFIDLVDPGNSRCPEDPGQQQRNVEASFPSLVRSRGSFAFWGADKPLPRDGLLVGVALYSVYDLQLLDDLEKPGVELDQVYIYSFSQLRRGDARFAKMPSGHPPYLSQVEGGEIMASWNGWSARAELKRRVPGLTLRKP